MRDFLFPIIIVYLGLLYFFHATAADQRPLCISNVCMNNGICYKNTTARTFECECQVGYTGHLCESSISDDDECNCENGGTCRRINSSFVCDCIDGYFGKRCEQHQTITTNINDDACISIKCPNNTKCVNRENGHECITSDNDQTNLSTAAAIIDHCSGDDGDHRCFNGGTCSNNPQSSSGFDCKCTIEWTGTRCDIDVDECEGVLPCENNATCVNLAGGYQCLCISGTQGRRCEINIDNCRPQPCINDGRCIDELDDFRCICPSGWSGKACEERLDLCRPNMCLNSATCVTSINGSLCICAAGFTGHLCETNIDDCIGRICDNKHHICVDGIQSYECVCPIGMQGDRCDQNINECSTNPCRNGATCVDTFGNYSCICRSGYTGKHCDTDIDECRLQGSCRFGICRNTIGDYQCFCHPGFSGDNCSVNLDDCQPPHPCLNGASCIDSVNSVVCLCADGFSGQFCQHSTSSFICTSEICKNNGTCQRNLGGSIDCLCLPDYTGRFCDERINNTNRTPVIGHQPHSLKSSSTNETIIITQLEAIDRCTQIQCQHGGTCHTDGDNQSSTVSCICHTGYTGVHCEIDIAECEPNPCENNGICHERSRIESFNSGAIDGQFSLQHAAGYVCICDSDYHGTTCSDVVNESITCDESPCSNHSKSCIDRNDATFRCECDRGWAGQRCDIELTGCDDDSFRCTNTAEQCHIRYYQPSSVHSRLCSCASGFGGQDCRHETTVSFTETSQLVHIVTIANASNSFRLSFAFRTTLTGVRLVTGFDILGRLLFAIELDTNGRLTCKLALSDDEQINIDLIGESVNNAHWWTIVFTNDDTIDGARMQLFDVNDVFVDEKLSRVTINRRIFTIKFGTDSGLPFAGCMRDIEINDGARIVPTDLNETSVNIRTGCIRSDILCNGNNTCGHDGRCIDLWHRYECECVRPYLLPNCELSIDASTFGHETNISYAIVDIDNAEQQRSLTQLRTDISALIRTRNANGSIFYLGSTNDDQDGGETFIAVELIDGQLRVNVKLGGRNIQTFTATDQNRIDDGRIHLLRVLRDENSIECRIDDQIALVGSIRRSFAHPLLVSTLIIGAVPSSVAVDRNAFTSVTAFKGTIQDVRLNGRHLLIWPLNDTTRSIESFGTVTSRENVLRGTVSDDACRNAPCGDHGNCSITFNDYECKCDYGWMGLVDCNQRNYCEPDTCPGETNCLLVGTAGGYICVGPGTFESSSSAVYELYRDNNSILVPNNTIGFKLRTRSQHGILLYLSNGNYNQFVLIGIEDGHLILRYPNETDIVVVRLTLRNVTDGQWHSIKIYINALQSTININGKLDRFRVANHKLDQLVIDTSRLTIGVPSHQEMTKHPTLFSKDAVGFKGCLDEVYIGNLPMLTFLPINNYGEYLDNSTHMKPMHIHRVLSGECRSDEQCSIDNSPCENGAICEDRWNLRVCRCADGFDGSLCQNNIDDCVGHQCSTNGTCIDGIVKYSCACNIGYMGKYCEIEIDECASNPCMNNARCNDLIGQFECECNANYTGDRCELLITVDCDSSPCQNGATCRDHLIGVDKLRSFQCECTPGYTGRSCENEIDYCKSPNPCLNGAECTSDRVRFTHSCRCMPGFTGTECQENIDECLTSPCSHGVCHDAINGYNCTCDVGWTATNCDIDVNECIDMPCMNNATCENTDGNYLCHCPEYYSGNRCEIEGSCLQAKCNNHAVCVQTNATVHRCECARGYMGELCEIEIDYCQVSPCINGDCIRKIGSYLCNCTQGYTGENCSIEVDECESAPCQHGVCIDRKNDFMCNCTGSGYIGRTCDIDIDECADMKRNCVFGECTNMPGTYRCTCNHGYIGLKCNRIDRCLPDENNRTIHRCEHGECHPLEDEHPSGDNIDDDYRCNCAIDYTGKYCDQLIMIERAKGLPLTYIVGPIMALLIIVALFGCCTFVLLARSKRATHGTYSPSRQELNGARVHMNTMMKPPPEERLI